MRIPQQTMDELESLVGSTFCPRLAEILRAVYREISGCNGNRLALHSTAMETRQPRAGTISRYLSPGSVHGLVSCVSGERLAVPKCDTPRACRFAFKPDWIPSLTRRRHALPKLSDLIQRAFVQEKTQDGMVGATGFEPVTSTV